MSDDVLAIMGQRHALRTLLFLRSHHGARFSEIEKALELNPAQLDRALKLLVGGAWALPETVPSTRGRIVVRYSLTKRGTAVTKMFDGVRRLAEKERLVLGDEAVDDLQKLLV